MSLATLDSQLLRFADALGDAVVFTRDGRIVGCNDSACRLFGYTRAELVNRDRDVLRLASDARVERGASQREQTGAFSGQLTFVRKDGSRFEGEISTVGLAGSDGGQLVCAVIHDLGDRLRADAATAAYRESTDLLQALADAAFEAVIIHRDGVILTANRAAEGLSGVARGQLIGKRLVDFIAPEAVPEVLARIAKGDDSAYTAAARRADGSTYPCEVQVRTLPVQVQGGQARVVALRDISARVQLEEQVRQSQKMEAVGRLAGGVAHDFNNLLSVIMSATSLASDRLAEGDPGREDLADVLAAAERAAELTRALLAFSRKQVVQTRVVDVDAMLAGMESMLRRLIGEDIELRVVPGSAGQRTRADFAQLENMVMNLVVNARDSMPDGGQLTLATAPVTLDEAWARTHLDTRPGPYLALTISDTGVGMNAATRARIFEPFFTTKGPGRGTGLGLSTVFGIVKQAGGSIWVESEPGHGATFTIYLPATEEALAFAPSAAAAAEPTAEPAKDHRTILLVEDEPQVRKVAAVILRQAGFTVLEAGSGADALALAAKHGHGIDLLLTDMVMPGMNGRQLAEALRALRPGLRVLFMSGYSEQDLGPDALHKPFAPETLLAKVRAVVGVPG